MYDADTREPVQQVARKAAISLAGQVGYGASADKSGKPYGTIEGENGYVTFLARDLETRSITLSIGDRITRIGKVDHDAYITRLQPMGHYPEYGNTLCRAYFQDREPAKVRI
jgi:hypothetical protein